jgi:mono/diheme cytochrome c family protein
MSASDSRKAFRNTNRNIVWGGITAFLLLSAIAYTSQTAGTERAKRGEYLVSSSGCHDCHTPLKVGVNGPEPDMSRMLSGHPEMIPIATPPELGKGPWLWAGSSTNTAFAGPWGLSFAMNLTSDRNTGLGIWTEDMFVAAIRTGRHMGTSRPINPPMPWPAYRNLNDEDLKSIYAYLRTVPPVVNHVPDYIPPAASVTTTQAEVR